MARGSTLVLTALVAGCALTDVAHDERFRGAIGYPNNLQIVAPDSVRSGQSFTLTVQTYAPDGCWRRDRTDVTVSGRAATITPYDVRRHERGQDCLLMPQVFTHTATLDITQPGVARLSIQGRDGTAVRSIVVE